MCQVIRGSLASSANGRLELRQLITQSMRRRQRSEEDRGWRKSQSQRDAARRCHFAATGQLLPAYSGPDLATAAHERKAASASGALRGRPCCDVPKRCRGTAKSGASRAGTTGPQPQRVQDPCRGRHPSELQLPGFHDSDESRGEHWKAVPECATGRQIAEEDQGETDGTDGKEIERLMQSAIHQRYTGLIPASPACRIR